MPAPDLNAVKAYFGASTGYPDNDIANALAAEKAAQAAVCKVPLDTEEWPADLAEALKRRVLRNLAMKALPLGTQPTGDGMGMVRLGPGDPEIRRLEAPHRKAVVG